VTLTFDLDIRARFLHASNRQVSSTYV